MERIDVSKLKGAVNTQVLTDDKVAISLNADGNISISMTQQLFAETVLESYKSVVGSGYRPPDDCFKVIGPCPRLSGLTLSDKVIRELLQKNMITEAQFKALPQIRVK